MIFRRTSILFFGILLTIVLSSIVLAQFFFIATQSDVLNDTAKAYVDGLFVLWIGLGACAGYALWQRILPARKTPYIVITVAWMLSTVLFFSPTISSDGVEYYAYIRSFRTDGNLQFTNEFDKTQSPLSSIATFPIYKPTGYAINAWSVGPALIWAPFSESILSVWSLRIMVRYLEFTFHRASDNFHDTITASMRSKQIMPPQAVRHQISNSLFFSQLLHPN